jgi:CBS domain containing-hemolysin-like protein
MTAVATRSEPPLAALVREPVYADEDTPLERLRREFERRRVHMAIIRNASGGFSGVVTLEDLLEEFVGEIQDEQDVGEVPPIVKRADGGFEVDGRLTLDVAERELGLQLGDVADVETLGGYVMARLEAIPKVGDCIEAAGTRLTVTEVGERRVRRMRVDPRPS